MSVVVCGRLSGFVDVERLVIKEGGVFDGDAFACEAIVNGDKVLILNSGFISSARPRFNTCCRMSCFCAPKLIFSFPGYSYAW